MISDGLKDFMAIRKSPDLFCSYKTAIKWLVFKGNKIYGANTHRLYKAQLDRALREMRKQQHVKVLIISGRAFLNAYTRAKASFLEYLNFFNGTV